MLCVSDTLVCDGIRHCPNGNEYDSDEDPELCLKHKTNTDFVSVNCVQNCVQQNDINQHNLQNFTEKKWKRFPPHRKRVSQNFSARRKCFRSDTTTKSDDYHIDRIRPETRTSSIGNTWPVTLWTVGLFNAGNAVVRRCFVNLWTMG